MASPKAVDQTFPAVSVGEELHPGTNTTFKVDSVSAEVAKCKEHKEQVEEEKKEKAKAKERKDATESLKSTVIISGVIVAVIGAIFAITKKFREP